MNDIVTPIQAEDTLCASCTSPVAENDAFCEKCGYPLKGSEFDQRNFIASRSTKEIDLADYHKKIKNAGIALYVVAGIMVLNAIMGYFTTEQEELKVGVAIVYLVVAMVFVALGGWSNKKPLTAIISGAALYGILLFADAVVEPLTIVKGVVIKAAIIVALVRGIQSAMEAEKVKKELNI